MKYVAKIRQFSFYEVVVEATSLKEIYAQIQEYLRKIIQLSLSSAVDLSFDIKSITQGNKNEHPKIKRKSVRQKPSKRLKPEGMEI